MGRHNKAIAKTVSKVVVVVVVMGTEDFLCDVLVFFFVWLENGAVVDVVDVVDVVSFDSFGFEIVSSGFVFLPVVSVVTIPRRTAGILPNIC